MTYDTDKPPAPLPSGFAELDPDVRRALTRHAVVTPAQARWFLESLRAHAADRLSLGLDLIQVETALAALPPPLACSPVFQAPPSGAHPGPAPDRSGSNCPVIYGPALPLEDLT